MYCVLGVTEVVVSREKADTINFTASMTAKACYYFFSWCYLYIPYSQDLVN